MSGIEVAGLAFGVLPILIETVKSYSAVARGFRAFRHYSKEIKNFAIQLKVQKGIFWNELRLLLRSIGCAAEMEKMLDDPFDVRWTSQQLDSKLGSLFQHDLDLYCGILQETSAIVKKLENKVAEFDSLLEGKQQADSMKTAIRRLRGRIKIVFDKSENETYLGILRDKNIDLGSLRAQHDAFRQQEIQSAEVVVSHKALPMRYGSIRHASQKLYEALCQHWCCDDLAHKGHYAKLCVAAKADAEDHEKVRLSLGISCQDPVVDGDDQSPSEPPLWLYTQSTSISSHFDMLQPGSNELFRLQSSLPTELRSDPLACMSNSQASLNRDQHAHPRKCVKRVHFGEPTSETSTRPCAMTSTSTVHVEINLCQEKDICSYLRQNSLSTNRSQQRQCVGYLETPHVYRHMFYLRHMQVGHPRPVDNGTTAICTLFNIMEKDVNTIFSIEDQLKLAYTTALAMLQYNDTPWLSERWRLRDLKYCGSADSFDNGSFDSLHLSSQISAPSQPASVVVDTEDTHGPAGAIKDEMRFGINNVTLFFLGVALLEIAHWKPIEAQMTSIDHENQIFAARRIASSRPSSLGPEYHRIAERCLQCNFGFGTSLGSKRLQTAVYNGVICGLENLMIK